ncbi:Smr/MutS family protein [bacterium]|nr:Smr/MutS family protein [bacterium]
MSETDALTQKTLEFAQVLQLISQYARWQPAKELIDNLRPYDDLEDLQRRQCEVEEGTALFNKDSFDLNSELFGDSVNYIKACQKNKALQPKELWHILNLAKSSDYAQKFLRSRQKAYPILSDKALRLGVFKDLEKKLNKALTAEGELSSQATPALARAKAELAASLAMVEQRLHEVLRDSRYSRMIQESVISRRFDRDVIPVKAEYRSHFPGLIIDQSASGATLFMEPASVLEFSNAARAAALAEKAEIQRILQSLSEEVGKYARSLLDSAEELANLEALRAIACYKEKVGAITAPVEDGAALRLIGARHPLLVEKLGCRVVPTTFDFPDGLKVLIMTGPNTGGKTVSLKCIGLLAMMAMTGLPITADSGSQLPFLEEIWADIGDEQSIMQNLSTFSAHINQIMRMLPKAGPRTLVLLDELGAGTDPVEGGALAEALLEHLYSLGTFAIVTTHLSELKSFASQREGMSNAAVEFDSETLAPTYRIIMGIPGKSNALKIAVNLGLPAFIERRAKELLGGDSVQVEGLLNELDREREVNERLAKKLRDQLSQLGRLRTSYEQKINKAEAECAEMISEASAETASLLDEARAKVHSLTGNARRQLLQLVNVRRQSITELRHAAAELSRALSDFEALEELIALSPVASKALALALRETVAYRRAHDTFYNAQKHKAGGSAEVSEVSDEVLPDLNYKEDSPSDQALIDIAFEDIGEFAESESREENFSRLDKLDKYARQQACFAEAELDSLTEKNAGLKARAPKISKRSLARRFDDTAAKALEVSLEATADAASDGDSQKSLLRRDLKLDVFDGDSEDAAAGPGNKTAELPLEVGSHVFVARYGQDGKVLSISEKKVEVQIGVIRIKVKREDLQVLEPENSEIGALPKGKMTFLSSRLDLHGKNVDEALWELGDFIDKAFMSGLRRLEIIHGKGTGTLRRAVIEYVKNHPSIASYRMGTATEGGIGATIVELNN